jgi:hypothetical protein
LSQDWKSELERLKQQPINEISKMEKEEQKLRESHATDLKRLMNVVQSQLTPVLEVFRENDGRAENQQPHLEKNSNGYMLGLPIIERGRAPVNLRLSFEFHLTKDGYVLKVKRDTEESIACPERTIEAPITKEKIQNEVKGLIVERNNILTKRAKDLLRIQRK